MVKAYNLIPGEDAEDHLWHHGLYVNQAFEVADGPCKLFPDPHEPDRMRMIGPDTGRALLTIIVTRPDDLSNCYIVTGWPASAAERTLYRRPGGDSDAEFASP